MRNISYWPRMARGNSPQRATFAAGCFWNVQEAFRHERGVSKTTVGYTGGTTVHPSYAEVCTGITGHAEAVQVVYDPSQVSYEKLLTTFWSVHDPTQRNRQGPDVGAQYRSAIFTHTPEQETLARESKSARENSQEIVTEIAPASVFYPAEEYHQRYLEKRGRSIRL